MPDITPVVGVLTVTGQTAALVLTRVIVPGTGSLSVAGQVPAFNLGIKPGTGALGVSGQAASVNFFLNTRTPGAGALSAVGRSPVVVYTEAQNVSRTPGAGALLAVGFGSGVVIQNLSTPGAGSLPAVSLVPAELNVDQTVSFAADQFEIALNDSAAFLTNPSFATIDLGFLDDLLVPQLVNAIKDATVDEVELHVLPNKMVTVLRGRDAAALAVDSTVFVTYAADPSQAQPPQQSGFSSLPVTPGVTVPIVLPGPWSAKRISEDLCDRVGLECSYGAPDYTLREDVAVNGSALSTIQSLVEPFSHFERSRVDIWLEGDTLVVRPRGGAGGGLVLDVHDTRISNLMVRSRFLGHIRVVRLTGSSTGDGLGLAVDPGDKEFETTDEMELDGVVVSRVVTRELRRVLDGAVKHQVIETFKSGAGFGLTVVGLVETTSTWDDLVLVFPNQIVNSPHERVRRIVTSAPGDTGALELQSRVTVIHSYDSNHFLKAQETINEDWDGADWVASSSETKTYRNNGPNMYQITTTQYDGDGAPGDVRRTTALGTPPGGPGRGFGAGGGTTGTPITLGQIISTLPGAKDVTITNASLLLEHLQIIMAQAVSADGATEHEVSFTAAGIPWLHRGQNVHLTGLIAEDGVTPIPFQNALVSEAKAEYRESNPSPTYLTHVKMLYWSP